MSKTTGAFVFEFLSRPPVQVIVAATPAASASFVARVMINLPLKDHAPVEPTQLPSTPPGTVAAAARTVGDEHVVDAPLQMGDVIVGDEIVSVSPAASAFVGVRTKTMLFGVSPATRVLGVADVHTILVCRL